MLMPNNIPATINSTKLPCASANDAMSRAAAADNDAMAKPRLRPILCINIVAGTAVMATATTIMDTGNVARA